MRPNLRATMPGSRICAQLTMPMHVEIEQLLELLRIGLAERRGRDAAGIRHQNVERAAGGFGRLHAGLDRRRIGDIGHDHTGRMTRRDRIVERGLLAAKDGHGRAGRRQRRRHGAADAAAAAGHESMPSRKQGHEGDIRQVVPADTLSLKFIGLKLWICASAPVSGRTAACNRSDSHTDSRPVPALGDHPVRPPGVRESLTHIKSRLHGFALSLK